jgi:hypothetical protein
MPLDQTEELDVEAENRLSSKSERMMLDARFGANRG